MARRAIPAAARQPQSNKPIEHTFRRELHYLTTMKNSHPTLLQPLRTEDLTTALENNRKTIFQCFQNPNKENQKLTILNIDENKECNLKTITLEKGKELYYYVEYLAYLIEAQSYMRAYNQSDLNKKAIQFVTSLIIKLDAKTSLNTTLPPDIFNYITNINFAYKIIDSYSGVNKENKKKLSDFMTMCVQYEFKNPQANNEFLDNLKKILRLLNRKRFPIQSNIKLENITGNICWMNRANYRELEAATAGAQNIEFQATLISAQKHLGAYYQRLFYGNFNDFGENNFLKASFAAEIVTEISKNEPFNQNKLNQILKKYDTEILFAGSRRFSKCQTEKLKINLEQIFVKLDRNQAEADTANSEEKETDLEENQEMPPAYAPGSKESEEDAEGVRAEGEGEEDTSEEGTGEEGAGARKEGVPEELREEEAPKEQPFTMPASAPQALDRKENLIHTLKQALADPDKNFTEAQNQSMLALFSLLTPNPQAAIEPLGAGAGEAEADEEQPGMAAVEIANKRREGERTTVSAPGAAGLMGRSHEEGIVAAPGACHFTP